jgi:hypothetical protein
LFFGLLGIVPLGFSINKKVSISKELDSAITAFSLKEQSLISAREDYNIIKPYISYLDVFMPEESNAEDYILNLNGAISSSGFFLRRVAVSKEVDNTVDMGISVDGYGDVADLLKNVEMMKRTTRINSVVINDSKGNERMELRLQIFSR